MKKLKLVLDSNLWISYFFGKHVRNYLDKILIDIGMPVSGDFYYLNAEKFDYAPLDEDTKITVMDMQQKREDAERVDDFEMLKKIKDDIKTVYFIGNEILNLERKLQIAVARDDFEEAIRLRVD